MKQWTKIKGENAWTMFKVISEMVDGFERLNEIGPCVSIFGSARTKSDHPHYQLAVDVAKRLTEEGFGVITGGGPGIMEAGNRGAQQEDGVSVGLGIDLPFETGVNEFVDSDKVLNHRFFFVRKVMFVKYAQGFVVLPGGLGTMDELFEVLTLMQTKKITKVPVVLVGKDYWSGLKKWIKNVMYKKAGNINKKDLDLMPIVETADEAVDIICNFYKKGKGSGELAPNYQME
ncbi:MAG: TIGR00730 family Rossman fold protein [Bacteroidota bacterium]